MSHTTAVGLSLILAAVGAGWLLRAASPRARRGTRARPARNGAACLALAGLLWAADATGVLPWILR